MSSNTPPLRTRRNTSDLSLDLTDLPSLTEPTPPSNTLLITNLQSPEIFTAANLDSIQRAISDQAALHSFAPLKSLRRIVVSFYTTEAALAIRQQLDGQTVLSSRLRVYFGAPTPTAVTGDQADRYLRAPRSSKLFFISPPPSPPVGWEMRDEEPPNKEVHAEDLASALSRLHARGSAEDEVMGERETMGSTQYGEVAAEGQTRTSSGLVTGQRSRSSTLVFDPADHGGSPHLPAIAVEDTSASPGDMSPMEGVEKKFPHTARPPVELMEA